MEVFDVAMLNVHHELLWRPHHHHHDYRLSSAFVVAAISSISFDDSETISWSVVRWVPGPAQSRPGGLRSGSDWNGTLSLTPASDDESTSVVRVSPDIALKLQNLPLSDLCEEMENRRCGHRISYVFLMFISFWVKCFRITLYAGVDLWWMQKNIQQLLSVRANSLGTRVLERRFFK